TTPPGVVPTNRTFLDMSQQATERARRQLTAQSGQIELSAVCPLLGMRTYIGEHQSTKSGSPCRTVTMPGLLIEEKKSMASSESGGAYCAWAFARVTPLALDTEHASRCRR